MQSGYFRVVRFVPDNHLLILDTDGLEDPGAEIVYCEWDYPGRDLLPSCVVHYRDQKYSNIAYVASVIVAMSNGIIRLPT